MTTLSITSRTGTVERALLNGGFDRKAFVQAAALVKDRIEAGRKLDEATRRGAIASKGAATR